MSVQITAAVDYERTLQIKTVLSLARNYYKEINMS